MDSSQSNVQPPVSKAEETVKTDVPGSVSASEPKAPQEAKRIGRVLLVEDDLPISKMYATKLEMEGFEAVVATNGEEGLKKLQEETYDLVLLDLMIPKLGGMEVLAKLRAEKKFAEVPVIVLSNLSQEQDIKKAHEMGVKDFLIKSNHTPSEVVRIVKGYFSQGSDQGEV